MVASRDAMQNTILSRLMLLPTPSASEPFLGQHWNEQIDTMQNEKKQNLVDEFVVVVSETISPERFA